MGDSDESRPLIDNVKPKIGGWHEIHFKRNDRSHHEFESSCLMPEMY